MHREILDSLAADDIPFINELYFINEGKILRCCQIEKEAVRFGDFDMETGKCSVKKGDKNEDKGIFRYGLTYVQYHDTVSEFIKRQESHGNKV